MRTRNTLALTALIIGIPSVYVVGEAGDSEVTSSMSDVLWDIGIAGVSVAIILAALALQWHATRTKQTAYVEDDEAHNDFVVAKLAAIEAAVNGLALRIGPTREPEDDHEDRDR